jgi:hypothetical protein
MDESGLGKLDPQDLSGGNDLRFMIAAPGAKTRRAARIFCSIGTVSTSPSAAPSALPLLRMAQSC